MQSKLMRWGSAARAASVVTLLATAGCSLFQPQPEPQPPPPPPKPQYAEPLATHTFAFDPKTTRVVGELQVTFSHHEDTFADIARRFNLGWDELVNANPGVDPWLPGEGTRIVLPTQFVLPDAEPEGVVVNLAALRLFYFPKPEKGQPRTVVTYPIGIGMVGWATPTGSTKIVSKRKDPVWTPPASVRKEHAADGDILPPTVPAGPDNPLGAFAMNLGWPTYLMHGTNKPAGVGMRASHGCIRLYPEDIAVLFQQIPIGTKVAVVNQPLVYQWQGDSLYVQSYPPHEEHPEAKKAAKGQRFDKTVSNKMFQVLKPHAATADWALVEKVVNDGRGVAVPVSRPGLTFDAYLASARQVENRIPDGSNWDGTDNPVPVARSAQPVASAGQ